MSRFRFIVHDVPIRIISACRDLCAKTYRSSEATQRPAGGDGRRHGAYGGDPRRGHRWLRMLETGETASMCEIARREGTDHSYVARHINLTLLALDIVAAILDEALPEGVRLHSLSINPPTLWEDQRRALG